MNEPSQLSASVIYDVVGTNKFEQDTDIDNPLMLGSTVRVSESTGGKMIFDGIVHECPTDINTDDRAVQFTAYDKLSILDYTMIPGTRIESDGTLPTFAWSNQLHWLKLEQKGGVATTRYSRQRHYRTTLICHNLLQCRQQQQTEMELGLLYK
jgi:hypothetical protein